MPFSLVVRRPPGSGASGGSEASGAAGNRLHLLTLSVPDTVPFAARRIRQEAEEREEKARLKERVLEMHKAQKEADETSEFSPSFSPHGPTPSTNHPSPPLLPTTPFISVDPCFGTLSRPTPS